MVMRAFTLIEMLVVIAIMAVLAAMTVAATSSFHGKTKMTRTRTAIAILQQALAIRQVEGRAIFSPVEHPLAGSKVPRDAFRRLADGTAVATAGVAFTGLARLDAVPPLFQSRVLLGTDIYADPDVPAFLGMERRHIGILGAPLTAVTDIRRLVDPGSGEVITDPDHAGKRLLTESTVSAHAQVIGNILEPSIAQELSGIGCLGEPESTYTTSVRGGRLLSDGKRYPTWKPGCIRDGSDWITYRLPGQSVRDGWGRDLLIGTGGSGGRLRIESAGVDGVFVWNPGPNGVIDADIATIATTVYAATWGTIASSGDDGPGNRDNIGITGGD